MLSSFVPGSRSYKVPSAASVESCHPPRILFLHIPKTAGTTLRLLAGEQYNSHELLTPYQNDVRQTIDLIERMDPAVKRSARFISCHVNYGIHRFFPGPSKYATILRDPVSRVVSTYHFICRTSNHFLSEKVRKMSLAEYVSSGIEGWSSNGQTKCLCGSEWEEDGFECTPNHLEAAKANLSEFAFVGLTEQFDALLVLMRRALGWRRQFFQPANVDCEKHEAPSEEAVRIIKEKNAFDIALYDWVRSGLERDRWQAGLGYNLELQAFSYLNNRPKLRRCLGSFRNVSPSRWLGQPRRLALAGD